MLRDRLGVKAAFATFVVRSGCWLRVLLRCQKTSLQCLARFLSRFDCSFPGKLFSFFQLLCRAALLLEIDCTFPRRRCRCLVYSSAYSGVAEQVFSTFTSCFAYANPSMPAVD